MVNAELADGGEGHQGASNSHIHWFVILAILVTIALLTPMPFSGRWADNLADFLHAPAFAVVTVICSLWATRSEYSSLKLWTTWVAVVVFATVAELSQQLTGRSASWHDGWANVVGCTIGSLVVAGWRKSSSRKFTWPLALFLMLWVQRHPSQMLWDCYLQMAQFPLLASFETDEEVHRWRFERSSFWRVDEPTTHGSHSLNVEFQPGQFPHMVYSTQRPDWSEFDRLRMDIFLPDEDPLMLILKIEDLPHNLDTEDRFHAHLELQKGWNHISIELSEVEKAPRGRKLLLSQVKRFELFAIHLTKPRSFQIDNVRLTRFSDQPTQLTP